MAGYEIRFEGARRGHTLEVRVLCAGFLNPADETMQLRVITYARDLANGIYNEFGLKAGDVLSIKCTLPSPDGVEATVVIELCPSDAVRGRCGYFGLSEVV